MLQAGRVVTRGLSVGVSFGALGTALAGGPSTGAIPITELPPTQYQTFEGGLYPGGANTPPAAHAAAALTLAQQIVPRSPAGNPDPFNGRIVMLSIGMSNTTHEFSPFERQEDLSTARNPRVLILNTAFGGQTASAIADPSAGYWQGVLGRVAAAGATAAQVQVAWLKEANAGPTQAFPVHAQALRDNLESVARNLHTFFPNLRIVYLSSRTYGGYATTTLNPEPYAYESAFSVKWAIEDQINGDPALNHNGASGPVTSPLMLWGPYLWADGLTPRAADGLTWAITDFEGDGTHPAPTGEQKVADLLSGFFTGEPSAQPWWAGGHGWTLLHRDAVADATVSASAPNANAGGATQLQVSGGAAAMTTYLKFDVSSVQRPVAYAKLSLRVAANAGNSVSLVSNTSWSEAAITWNNAPAINGGLVVNVPTSTRDGTFSADVTGAVNADADGILTFALTSPQTSPLTYLSKEGGQPPRLVLVLAPPPCPGDANGDRQVTFADVTAVFVTYGGSGPLGDANHDGNVDFADVTNVFANWNAACP